MRVVVEGEKLMVHMTDDPVRDAERDYEEKQQLRECEYCGSLCSVREVPYTDAPICKTCEDTIKEAVNVAIEAVREIDNVNKNETAIELLIDYLEAEE